MKHIEYWSPSSVKVSWRKQEVWEKHNSNSVSKRKVAKTKRPRKKRVILSDQILKQASSIDGYKYGK